MNFSTKFITDVMVSLTVINLEKYIYKKYTKTEYIKKLCKLDLLPMYNFFPLKKTKIIPPSDAKWCELKLSILRNWAPSLYKFF